MRYEELKDAITNAMISVSPEASDVLQYVLDRYDEDSEDIDESSVYDAISEECDSMFTYYSDAWDYLRDNGITDFDEAINECGCTNVCSIAWYYLRQEVEGELCL